MGGSHYRGSSAALARRFEAVLIYSMSVSVDGFIADREGAFGWSVPNEEQFAFHIVQTRELGGFLCGRRLYETMLVWETDLSLRDDEAGAEFADVWCAIPKVVFSRTLDVSPKHVVPSGPPWRLGVSPPPAPRRDPDEGPR